MGSKKNPIWRVVVADQRSPRDGRVIESIGQYNPQTEPSTIKIDRERLQHWIDLGAKPTNTVLKLMRAPDTVPVEVAAPVAVAEPPAAAEPASPEAAEADAPVAEAQAPADPAPAESGDAASGDDG